MGHHDTEGDEVARQRDGTLRGKPNSEGYSDVSVPVAKPALHVMIVQTQDSPLR